LGCGEQKNVNIQHFYDKVTGTLSYIIIDPKTKLCAIIDSVMDYDPASGKLSTESADRLIHYVLENKLTVEWILETHIHADHLTAARYIKNKLGGITAIGAKISLILDYWGKLFDITNDSSMDNFDHVFQEGEAFTIGELKGKVIYTPGHTPICASYVIGDAVFVGDTLFAPTRGTARADFPGGEAKTLYQSIHKLYQLSDDTKVYICHDYPEENQEPYFMATILEHKKNNIMVAEGISEEAYIEKRTTRDKTLSVPRLIFPSIQYNMRAGDFGKQHQNGFQFLHMPINFFK
jgi:glyoxylase-like metal-dependent hydrolase (beta-lactamase superfamily II)